MSEDYGRCPAMSVLEELKARVTMDRLDIAAGNWKALAARYARHREAVLGLFEEEETE